MSTIHIRIIKKEEEEEEGERSRREREMSSINHWKFQYITNKELCIVNYTQYL